MVVLERVLYIIHVLNVINITFWVKCALIKIQCAKVHGRNSVCISMVNIRIRFHLESYTQTLHFYVYSNMDHDMLQRFDTNLLSNYHHHTKFSLMF